jgi:glucoamylase
LKSPDHRAPAPEPPESTPAHWAWGEKIAVGAACGERSRVWFTVARGVVTEIFFPSPDQACTRELRFVVTDGAGFVSEEGDDTTYEGGLALDGSMTCTVVTTCNSVRYRIEKEIVADPILDAVLVRVRFVALAEPAERYRLFAVLVPHLANLGGSDTATTGKHKGRAMLYAHRDGTAVALASSAPWRARSVGYVHADDASDRAKLAALTGEYDRAGPGNVALTGEIDLGQRGETTLVVAFGTTVADAAHQAVGALTRGFDVARTQYSKEWAAWHDTLRAPWLRSSSDAPLLRQSLAVLKTLEAKGAPAGRVASLATPWGASRGPGIEGTYHLVWTRDLVESVGALLAVGSVNEARRAVFSLRCSQEEDGHWPQNMHLDGRPAWNKTELDESALPVIFVHLAEREGALDADEVRDFWPMLERAASFIVARGPASKKDRWEDAAGVTPFTVSAEIVALLVCAEAAEKKGDASAARRLRDTADEWNARIESLLYRRGGPLAEAVGVEGYYMRVGPPSSWTMDRTGNGPLPESTISPHELSVDALALVRFGLRAADDPRIVSTVRVIDAILKTELASGPSWRRYPNDHYGEREDGSPFDFSDACIGRPWPLLAGERAHYEVARGDLAAARSLRKTIESFANAAGLLPEQTWDAGDIPARGLRRGAPSGSATPLGWAHAEYVKLCRSIAEGRVFDMPRHAHDRYVLSRSTGRR